MNNTIADFLSHRRHDTEVGIQVNVLSDGNVDFFDEVKRLTPSDRDLEPIVKAVQQQRYPATQRS